MGCLSRHFSDVVSKAKRMVDASIALFARFGGNDRIAELTSMLEDPPPFVEHRANRQILSHGQHHRARR